MKNISSNKNFITIAVVCVCCVVIFAAVAILIARNKSDKTDYNDNAGITGTQLDSNGNLIVAEGSDYLPESCVGSWEVAKDAHVLQSPRNADISEEEAVKAEYNSDILLAYDSYKNSRTGSVFSPYYKVKKNCGAEVLDAVGIQSDGIMDEFGKDAEITQIDVYDQSGTNLYDTIFIIEPKDTVVSNKASNKNSSKDNDKTIIKGKAYLVYYGTGNFVFAATKVDAVG